LDPNPQIRIQKKYYRSPTLLVADLKNFEECLRLGWLNPVPGKAGAAQLSQQPPRLVLPHSIDGN
jgi:hypothetical protein